MPTADGRTVSLAHLTAITLNPPELIRAAFRTGYDAVGLRLVAVTADSPGYALERDAALMRATKAAMAETGITVFDIEFIKITPEINVAALEPVIAAGAELGARHVIAAPYDPDLGRLADRFGALCDLGARYGIGGVLEFFPWTVVPSLAAALSILDRAGRDNAGVLIDTLHFARSGAPLVELSRVPPARVPFIHVCDAPAERPTTLEGLLHHARAERLPPGEGGIEIAGVLARLPPAPIALEVPMDTLARDSGPEEVLRRCRVALDRLLARQG